MDTLLKIIIILLALYVLRVVLERWLHPATRAHVKATKALRWLKIASKLLPNGIVLNIRDREVREVAEAMLIDGFSTKEINEHILRILEEKRVRVSKEIIGILHTHTPIERVVGCD